VEVENTIKHRERVQMKAFREKVCIGKGNDEKTSFIH
jgi:hypothetical protein